MPQKLILVIGATGAQGLAVIDSLLAPATDGSRSPYSVRALTRDPSSRRATELAVKGVEVVQGDTDHLDTVARALKNTWGAWVNIDTFTVGELKEVFSKMRIFELAHQVGVRHHVWSGLDYIITGYNDLYRTEHYDAKVRVVEFMRLSPSVVNDTALSWSREHRPIYGYDSLSSIWALGPARRGHLRLRIPSHQGPRPHDRSQRSGLLGVLDLRQPRGHIRQGPGHREPDGQLE